MKNFKLLFSAAVASALIGCSSMEVDDQDALAENFPADFKYQEYMAIHPELRYLQLKDQVDELNASADASLKAADSAAFDTNTAQLYAMYMDPYMGGYTQANWDKDWADKEVDDTLSVDVYKMVAEDTTAKKKVFHVDSSKALTVKLCDVAAKTVVKPKTVKNDDGTKDTIFVWQQLKGVVDGPCTATGSDAPVINISDSTYQVIEGSVLLGKKKVAGGVPADKLKKLKALNLISTLDDYKTLQALPVDTFAISYQFTLFGKLHGWAYRPCNDAEKLKPVATPVYPADKLYCDDNGDTKEIN